LKNKPILSAITAFKKTSETFLRRQDLLLVQQKLKNSKKYSSEQTTTHIERSLFFSQIASRRIPHINPVNIIVHQKDMISQNHFQHIFSLERAGHSISKNVRREETMEPMDIENPISPTSVISMTNDLDKVRVHEMKRMTRRLSNYKSTAHPSPLMLNRVKSEEKQKIMREKKLQQNRNLKREERRTVRFAEDVKRHDGLSPKSLVINTLVWECFNMRLRCVGDVLKKIQPKHLHHLADAYEHLSELCKMSKENPSRRFKILPRGGGKQLEIKFEHHYTHLRALRKIVRKTHNRLHIAANAAIQANKKGGAATAYVLRHMEWQERREQAERKERVLRKQPESPSHSCIISSH